MGYRPPKGLRPPQLEGKRTGRRRGSRNYQALWAEVEWAYEHRHGTGVGAPSVSANIWWRLAASFPDEFAYWYEAGCQVVDSDDFYNERD